MMDVSLIQQHRRSLDMIEKALRAGTKPRASEVEYLLQRINGESGLRNLMDFLEENGGSIREHLRSEWAKKPECATAPTPS